MWVCVKSLNADSWASLGRWGCCWFPPLCVKFLWGWGALESQRSQWAHRLRRRLVWRTGARRQASPPRVCSSQSLVGGAQQRPEVSRLLPGFLRAELPALRTDPCSGSVSRQRRHSGAAQTEGVRNHTVERKPNSSLGLTGSGCVEAAGGYNLG